MSNIPDFYEVRFSLDDVLSALKFYVGDESVINTKETIRLMLGQYFYGETPKTVFATTMDHERTLVWPITGQSLFGHGLDNAFETLGEVFWAMADKISHYALHVSPEFQLRPSDCFYKYFPLENKVVLYIPAGNVVSNLTKIAGPAVVIACSETLPSYYRK